MKIIKNPVHDKKLQYLNTASDFSGDFLKLDQTTPQHVVNGMPEFDGGIKVPGSSASYYINLSPVVHNATNYYIEEDATVAFYLSTTQDLQVILDDGNPIPLLVSGLTVTQPTLYMYLITAPDLDDAHITCFSDLNEADFLTFIRGITEDPTTTIDYHETAFTFTNGVYTNVTTKPVCPPSANTTWINPSVITISYEGFKINPLTANIEHFGNYTNSLTTSRFRYKGNVGIGNGDFLESLITSVPLTVNKKLTQSELGVLNFGMVFMIQPLPPDGSSPSIATAGEYGLIIFSGNDITYTGQANGVWAGLQIQGASNVKLTQGNAFKGGLAYDNGDMEITDFSSYLSDFSSFNSGYSTHTNVKQFNAGVINPLITKTINLYDFYGPDNSANATNAWGLYELNPNNYAKKLYLGATAAKPTELLELGGGNMVIYSNSANASANRNAFYKSRNTYASPTVITSGDLLGETVFYGHDGTNYIRSASIKGRSRGTIGTNTIPSQLEFHVATNNNPSVETKMVVIDVSTSTFFNAILSASTITAQANAIVTTPTTGLVCANNTAATAATPVQMSPRIRFAGNVWNTTGAGSNETSAWAIENRPTSGTSPSSNLRFGYSADGGAYSYPVVFSSNGSATISGGTTGIEGAPLVVKQLTAYASPYDQYIQIWKSSDGTNIAHLRADGSLTNQNTKSYYYQARGNGSVSIPVFAGGGSGADNGMWFPSTTSLAFSTAGTERMRITNGNVGIGMTPVELLDVNGNAKALKILTPEVKTDTTTPTDLTITTGADKTAVLATPVWDDLQVGINNIAKGASAPTDRLTAHGVGSGVTFPVLGFDKGNYIYFDVQTPHSMKLNTTLGVHIHFTLPNTTTIGHKIVWQLDVVAADIDGTWSVPTGSPFTTTYTVAANDDTKHRLFNVGLIPAVNAGVSTIYKCKLTRIDGTATEYASEVYMEYIDCHYQKDTIGSRQEGVK